MKMRVIMHRKFFDKLKMIHISDIIALVFVFPVAFICSLFYRSKNKDLILICESENEARDNGYFLFKYIGENHPEQHVAYAIKLNSPDALKVTSLGECIEYGSFKHWIYYLSAGVNVSTQKGGKPNAAVFYLLEGYGIIKNKRLFLQHGITISEAKWLYYENTKMTGFVCGAKPEYEEIKERYGYPEGSVRYLGFPRFDNLHNLNVKKNQILLMPSWREWLVLNTPARQKFGEGEDFVKTEYYTKWNEFLSNELLIQFLEENQLQLIFYPHRNIQPYLNLFTRTSDNIKFASWKEQDIQQLLKESALLITDYSSVFMDFSYMKKPVIFYQFDYDKFREAQYAEGYYDYKDGFGPVFENITDLVESIKEYYREDFTMKTEYLSKVEEFFPLYDNNNSERNYLFTKELLDSHESKK